MSSSKLWHRPSALAALLIASACTAAAPPVTAAPPAHSDPILSLDVVDRESGKRRSLRLTLPISDQGGSHLETEAGQAGYRLHVHRQTSSEPNALQIALERSERRKLERGEQRRDISLNVRIKLTRGQRAVLTRLERADGTSTEVSATLR